MIIPRNNPHLEVGEFDGHGLLIAAFASPRCRDDTSGADRVDLDLEGAVHRLGDEPQLGAGGAPLGLDWMGGRLSRGPG